MVFDEISGRIVSVPIGAFAAAVATLLTRREGPTVGEILDATGPAKVAPEARETPPKAKKRRGAKAKLEAGQKLEHRHFGEVVATATYRGPGKFQYGKKTYTSISAAANAAAADLGQKSASLNGWVFWGAKKR